MLRFLSTSFVDIRGDLYSRVWVVHVVFEIRVIHKLQLQRHLRLHLLPILLREPGSNADLHTHTHAQMETLRHSHNPSLPWSRSTRSPTPTKSQGDLKQMKHLDLLYESFSWLRAPGNQIPREVFTEDYAHDQRRLVYPECVTKFSFHYHQPLKNSFIPESSFTAKNYILPSQRSDSTGQYVQYFSLFSSTVF